MDGASVQDPNELNEGLLHEEKRPNYTFFRKDVEMPQRTQTQSPFKLNKNFYETSTIIEKDNIKV